MFCYTFQSGDVLKNDLSASEINMTVVNVTTFSTQTNVFNLTESELFPEEVRVYFLNMYPVHARRIMCRVRLHDCMTAYH